MLASAPQDKKDFGSLAAVQALKDTIAHYQLPKMSLVDTVRLKTWVPLNASQLSNILNGKTNSQINTFEAILIGLFMCQPEALTFFMESYAYYLEGKLPISNDVLPKSLRKQDSRKRSRQEVLQKNCRTDVVSVVPKTEENGVVTIACLLRRRIADMGLNPDSVLDRETFLQLAKEIYGNVVIPFPVFNSIIDGNEVDILWLGQLAQLLKKEDGSFFTIEEVQALHEQCICPPS